MDYQKTQEQIEGILEQMPEEQREQFRRYFQNAPAAVWSSINIEKRGPDKVLVEENERITKVYVLLNGTVRALDYRVKGSVYEFARFEPVVMLGSMECFFGIPRYMTTLLTVTSCTLLSMPRQVYEEWLWQDPCALRAEAESMRTYLLDRARDNRVMLLLNGMERLLYLLVRICRSMPEAPAYLLHVNRQELAEQTGTSVKTVNRSIKKLEEDGFLQRQGHKVKITQNQYRSMAEYLEIISNIG